MIKFDHGRGDLTSWTLKWKIEQGTFRIFVGGNDQTDVINADVEEQRGRHQLGVAHIIVFVFI